MSQKNVEKVRRGFAEYNRGDVEGALQEWAPDAVWDWSNGHGFDAGVCRGRDEIRALAAASRSSQARSGISITTTPIPTAGGTWVRRTAAATERSSRT